MRPAIATAVPAGTRSSGSTGDYRDLYRGGRVRRIVAQEHTSLLPADERVRLENSFKSSGSPEAPNVLACTPTLELGIDIGDLSMVALTSLPRSTASYLQRVGRAGRLTGNALVVSLLPARPARAATAERPADDDRRRGRPARLLPRRHRICAGSTSPRWSTGTLGRPTEPHAARQGHVRRRPGADVVARPAARRRPANAAGYVDAFLRGFGDAVSKDSAADLRRWAGNGIAADEVPGLERVVQTAVMAWNEEGAELAERIALIQSEVARMEEKPSLDEAGERDLKRLRGELGAARQKTRSDRERAYWISALEAGAAAQLRRLSTTRRGSTSACGGPTRKPASTRPPMSSTSAAAAQEHDDHRRWNQAPPVPGRRPALRKASWCSPRRSGRSARTRCTKAGLNGAVASRNSAAVPVSTWPPARGQALRRRSAKYK